MNVKIEPRKLGGGRMKFKEFKSWCEQRACEGCWGLAEAKASIADCKSY